MSRRTLLISVLVVIVASIWYLESRKPDTSSTVSSSLETVRRQEKEGKYPPAAELVNPSGFLNAPSTLRIGDLIGKKVVLVDFWTYSCINCQRTLPYLNAWYQKYHDKGLEIIGVHTPEFEFEKDRDNVAAAIEKFGIKYPVVQDNDFATWRAYNNRYWPHEYLIDIDGYMVHDHIGEGDYDETEAQIQKLLEERLVVLGEKETIGHDMAAPSSTIAFDPNQVASPEIYFGSDRNEYLANGSRGAVGKQSLKEPKTISLNKLYLVGDWNFETEFATNVNAPAKILFRYNAKNVYMVASADEPVEMVIKQDGKEIKTLTIQQDQLYSLIDGADYGEHLLEIEIKSPGLKAFTFTFG